MSNDKNYIMYGEVFMLYVNVMRRFKKINLKAQNYFPIRILFVPRV